jgi:hypothetical protein
MQPHAAPCSPMHPMQPHAAPCSPTAPQRINPIQSTPCSYAGGWPVSSHPGTNERLLWKSASVTGFFLLRFASHFRSHLTRLLELVDSGKLKVRHTSITLCVTLPVTPDAPAGARRQREAHPELPAQGAVKSTHHAPRNPARRTHARCDWPVTRPPRWTPTGRPAGSLREGFTKGGRIN